MPVPVTHREGVAWRGRPLRSLPCRSIGAICRFGRSRSCRRSAVSRSTAPRVCRRASLCDRVLPWVRKREPRGGLTKRKPRWDARGTTSARRALSAESTLLSLEPTMQPRAFALLIACAILPQALAAQGTARSEEHTSELQSLAYLVCRLLLEKKKKRLNKTYKCMN